MAEKKYEFQDHTADVKFTAWGKDNEEMFVSAAKALNESIAGGIKINPAIYKKISVSGHDMESLLHNFLEEFLFVLETKEFITSKIKEISVDEKKLEVTAEVNGDHEKNYVFTNEVKAITYNGMEIKNKNGNVACTVTLDV